MEVLKTRPASVLGAALGAAAGAQCWLPGRDGGAARRALHPRSDTLAALRALNGCAVPRPPPARTRTVSVGPAPESMVSWDVGARHY
jgi:hypothetical protein